MAVEILDSEVVREPAPIVRLDAGARAEVDLQVSTAKAFPRSMKRAMDMAKSMVTASSEIARSCLYAVPRDGKMIQGPSIRLGEAMVYAFGNMRCKAGIKDIGETTVTCYALVWDLERNNVISRECVRRITKRDGRRYSEDMIATTINAGQSIALRNAIFEAIPKAFVNEVYEFAKDAAVGKIESLDVRRRSMLDTFKAMGVTPDRIFAKLGITDEREITRDHIAIMIGVHNHLQEDGVDVEDEFPEVPKPGEQPPAPPPANGSKMDAAADAIRGKSRVSTRVTKPRPGEEPHDVPPAGDDQGVIPGA